MWNSYDVDQTIIRQIKVTINNDICVVDILAGLWKELGSLAKRRIT